MKITELKCTACNGTLKFDDKNPKIAVCEYCGTHYAIEQEAEQDFYLVQEGIKNWYQTIPDKEVKLSGWESYGWKRITLVVILFLLFIGVKVGVDVIVKPDVVQSNGKPVNGASQDTANEDEKEAFTGLFALMAESVLGKPAEELTDEDLSVFEQLQMSYTTDSIKIGYALKGANGEETELKWISYSRDNAELGLQNLKRFKGLKKLNINGYIKSEMIEGLSLVSLGCYADSPEDIAEYSGAADLEELIFNSTVKDLNGLDKFSKLSSLTIDGSRLSDIRQLVQLKKLTSLNLIRCDEVNDFSPLSAMPWLETLEVDSEGLRDIGFVSALTNLKSLTLSGGQMLQVNELKEKTGLVSLSIIDCGELKDLSGIEGISGLKELSLEIPYDCPQPSLSQMTGLTKLSISSADDVSFLMNMPSLENLTLDRCKINNNEAFAGLSSLKQLICINSRGDLTDWSFINQIPSIEYIDLSGISTYGDLSGLFSIPTLQELYLNGVECEINFSNIQQNGSLKVLEMDHVKLYTNVSVSGSGAIHYVNYDDVSLDSHLDFLAKFPELERLNLANNSLTQVNFAVPLVKLQELNIDGNYVTDIKPLSELLNLNSLLCKDNPISNYKVLSNKVSIVK